MALGIRDLSKKLSHIKLKLNVRNIFLLVKAHDETLIEYARELAQWLMQKDEKFIM
jgi:NAD+ kinase